jgi:hypothetical protein
VRSRAIVAAFLGAASLGLLATALAAATQLSQAAPYPTALLSAASALEATTAIGGPGYRFDVVQRQVEYPKAGASSLPLVDAASPQTIVGQVDHLYVNSVLARGRVTPTAFWMEMRFGPGETTAPSFDIAPTLFGVIAKSGNLWRNDGQGWYATTMSPGVGMDPATAALLPTLLRNVTKVTDLGQVTLAGQSVHRFAGLVDIANFPGVVASDGAPFTESPIAVDVWLDASNRVVQLEGRTRNLNESVIDLKIDTVISFAYLPVGVAPNPSPLIAIPTAPGAPPAVPSSPGAPVIFP